MAVSSAEGDLGTIALRQDFHEGSLCATERKIHYSRSLKLDGDWTRCVAMPVKVIAKDDFQLPAVASCVVRGEAHETITAACHREAVKSRLSRIVKTIGSPANCNVRAVTTAWVRLHNHKAS